MELDTIDTETVQSMIGVVLEHGDPIQKRAAVVFGNKIGQVMLEQIPGMREIAGEMVEELRNEGMPEEIADELFKSIEPPPGLRGGGRGC